MPDDYIHTNWQLAIAAVLVWIVDGTSKAKGQQLQLKPADPIKSSDECMGASVLCGPQPFAPQLPHHVRFRRSHELGQALQPQPGTAPISRLQRTCAPVDSPVGCTVPVPAAPNCMLASSLARPDFALDLQRADVEKYLKIRRPHEKAMGTPQVRQNVSHRPPVPQSSYFLTYRCLALVLTPRHRHNSTWHSETCSSPRTLIDDDPI